MSNVENSVIPNESIADDTTLLGVPVMTVKSGTQLFLQSECTSRISDAYPTWFSGLGMACAYCLRKGSGSSPVGVKLARDVRLVHLVKRETVEAVVNALSAKMQSITSQKEALLDDQHRRFAQRRLSYEQKRLNKLLTAIKFATGLQASKQDQEEILSNVFGQEQKLRDGFDTEEAIQMNVQLDDTLFGNDAGKFNRVSVAKYDYVMTIALKEALPWADGYVSAGTPSTWHVNQLYPSEVCLFQPGHCLDASTITQVPEYADISTQIETSEIPPLSNLHPDSYSTRIYIGPKPVDEQPQSGGAKSSDVANISLTVEMIFPNMKMDNPLSVNEVSTDAANHDAWNICPPPKKNR